MEKFGIVSENAGTKPREVLIDYAALNDILEGMK
jgi:hypothetical protein